MAGVKDLLGQTDTVRRAYQALEGLISLAFTDPTTGLPNRSALNEVTKLPLGFEGPGFGAVMIDLTEFKRVNDAGSHAAGDTALGYVGKTIAELCDLTAEAPLGLPFRYGGDEFCILVPASGFEAFVEKTNLGRLRWSDFSVEEKNLGFSASVGFAAPDEDVELTNLIERADAAAKMSKRHNDEPVRWSSELVHEETVSHRKCCPSCSATVTILVRRTNFSPNAFLLCTNCGEPMAAGPAC